MAGAHRRYTSAVARLARFSERRTPPILCLSTVCLFAAAAVVSGQQPEVKYVYDDIGRLVAVVDPSGESASYTYDAVGNVLSIIRSASSVKILNFSPRSGAVATAVAIDGTGFSAVAADNVVSFNGVGATVTSATTTRLVVAVPVGATTGTIAVTSPSGSANSSSPFTVTGASDAPTISAFSPTIAMPGAVVSIDGSNFDAVLTNNKLSFNTTFGSITSSTATTIAASVPAGATSGRISIKTPRGGALSAADFFVPPSPFVVADVQTTGRMAVGESKSFALTTANRIALVLFDGVKNQRVSLRMTGVTIAGTYVYVRTPAGTELASDWVSTSSDFIDSHTLPATGSYTILIDPLNANTGSMTLTLHDVPPDPTGPITAGGAPVSVTTTTPGQNAVLSFSGVAGQRVSLRMSGVTISSSVVSVRKPDGAALATANLGTAGAFIDTVTLPSTGGYTIAIDPTLTNTGTMTLTLYDVPPDVTGTIGMNGSPVTVTTTTPGQNAVLTFSGVAGQRVSLRMSDVTITGSDVSIRRPDGTTLADEYVGISGEFIDTLVLPATGDYTILVNPTGSNTGSMTLTMYEVPVDVTGTIGSGGPPVTVTTTTPGQNVVLTFPGTAGQRVSLRTSDVTIALSAVSIRKPDGTVLASKSAGMPGDFIDTQTLPTTGNYTVVVDPVNSDTGTMTLTLYEVVDVTGSITVGGSSVSVTTTTPGQNAVLTLEGTQGQQVTVRMTSNTVPHTTVRLRKPDATNLVSTSSALSAFNLATQTLPVTGTYTVLVDPSSTYTGSLTVTVTNP